MTEHRAPKRSGLARDDRIPPHSLEAEEAALGAVLLSRDAAEAVTSLLLPDDWYKPGHQHIAQAVRELMADDDPVVDVVTVAEQLRREGLLEEVGGVAYLAGLMNATPSISSATRYARIVKDAAVLRRLLHTAVAISELGYSSDDPSAAVAQAGELLSRMDAGDVATLSSLEVADLKALLASDLQPMQPTLLTRSDGGSLLYPGKVHTVQAEPSTGKSWLGLFACVQVLALGGSAGMLDYEDVASTALSRLLALGADPAAIAERFYYAQPTGRFGPAERLDLFRAVERMNLDIVVIDGVGESLSREGLSEDKADDVLRWADLLPRPIARTGAAVLLIDHVAKDPEQRGRWARGSGAKLGMSDGATYQAKVRIPFSRHRAGRFDLIVAKDRPGGVGAIGETVATVSITPHAAGERVVVEISPHSAEVGAPTDTWKPTVLMGKIAQALAESSTPLTATQLKSLVHSERPQLVREALSRLIAEGFVAETGKSPKKLRLVRPYDGAPSKPAPAWREEPPPELFDDTDYPTADEIAEIDGQRFAGYTGPDF